MSTTHDPGDALRSLLAAAVTDGPATPDLLAGVRRRQRRRRVLVPAASLAAAGACGVTAFAVVSVDTAPSAQAQVLAAAGRSSGEGFRVHIAGGSPATTCDGAFDPGRRTGRMSCSGSGRQISIGGTVYTEVIGGKSRDLPAGKRWVSSPRLSDAQVTALPASVTLFKVSPYDPQLALQRLRSATAIRQRGPASGPGWTGHRYSFTLTDQKDAKRPAPSATGTVEIDSHGLVRVLDITMGADGSAAKGRKATADHVVLRFGDYGTHVTVTPPPAGQVVSMAALERSHMQKGGDLKKGGANPTTAPKPANSANTPRG